MGFLQCLARCMELTFCVPAQTIFAISSILSSSLFDSPDSWAPAVLHATLQEEQNRLDVPRKLFMTTIRHALTGMKASTPQFKCFTYSWTLLSAGWSRYR